jgi:hypothetical protein
MKIYTYKNSINIDKAQYWDEIKELPHFCAAEVLTQGMKSFYGRMGFSCLSSVDEFINNIYPNWNSPSKDVDRYKRISKYIQDLDSIEVKEEIITTLRKNKRQLLEAVKYVIETEDLIRDNNYDEEVFKNLGNKENELLKVFRDKILKRALEDVKSDSCWEPDWATKNATEYKLPDAIRNCNKKEIRKLMQHIYNDGDHIKEWEHNKLQILFESLFDALGEFNPSEEFLSNHSLDKEKLLSRIGYTGKEIKHIRDSVVKPDENPSNRAFVFHGIYRLQPIHLRLFTELERANYEVIILNCFNRGFKNIYSCWVDLYKVLIDQFRISSANIVMDDTDDDNHREIGVVFGNLLEGKHVNDFFKINKAEFGSDIAVNKDNLKLIFDGIEELSIDEIIDSSKKESNLKQTFQELKNYLSNKSKILMKFDSTMQFVDQVSTIFDNTEDVHGNRQIGRMTEQFYGANGTDMNSIFQVFYPDEFGVKPFLSYPIGQFILALYNMWDTEKNKLVFNSKDLVECLALDVWPGITPMILFEKIRNYTGIDKMNSGIELEEFIDKIEQLKSIRNGKWEELVNKLKNLSYFSVDSEDYDLFIKVIKNIELIAQKVFKNGKLKTSKEHFANMIKIIHEEKQWKKLSGEEQRLIQEIDNRLKTISDDEDESDLSTIKDTLGFYLANKEGTNINWLVRDLDQIEGDLLSEAGKAKEAKLGEKCYHFALLSNENMLDSTLNDLPWPLTEDFVLSSKKAELFNKILKNNVKYKRCLLFQGLYYLINNPLIKLKLSYIENEGERPSTPYNLLEQLMKVDSYENNKPNIKTQNMDPLEPKKVNVQWNSKAQEVFSTCPWKFVFSYGLDNPSEQYNNELQVKMYLGRVFQLMIAWKWDNLPKNKLKEEKYNNLKAWTLGDKGKYRKLKGNENNEKLLPEIVAPYVGKYMGKAEVKKSLENNLEYMKKELFKQEESTEETVKKNFDEQLIRCWFKEASKHELFNLENKKKIPPNRRINDYGGFNPNEYINEFMSDNINNNGLYFKKMHENLEYKVSEYICMYCSLKDICLYPNRMNPIHLLRKDEEKIQN